MKCLGSKHIYFIWVAQSCFFYQRNRSVVHGGERHTKSVSTYILSGLPNPIFSIREIVALCMGESDIPNLRLWSPRLTKKCGHVRDMVDL